MDNDQKAMQPDSFNVPEHLREIERQMPKQFVTVQHGRGFGKRARMEAAERMLQVVRPVQPTSRTVLQRVAFGRKPAGITDTRGVPSWVQQREPNGEQDIVHATKPTPWVKKRRARARNKAARASRKANR